MTTATSPSIGAGEERVIHDVSRLLSELVTRDLDVKSCAWLPDGRVVRAPGAKISREEVAHLAQIEGLVDARTQSWRSWFCTEWRGGALHEAQRYANALLARERYRIGADGRVVGFEAGDNTWPPQVRIYTAEQVAARSALSEGVDRLLGLTRSLHRAIAAIEGIPDLSTLAERKEFVRLWMADDRDGAWNAVNNAHSKIGSPFRLSLKEARRRTGVL